MFVVQKKKTCFCVFFNSRLIFFLSHKKENFKYANITNVSTIMVGKLETYVHILYILIRTEYKN